MFKHIVCSLALLCATLSAEEYNTSKKIHISLQANPFTNTTFNPGSIGYETQAIPATLDFSIGRNVRFELGFGMNIKELSSTTDLSQFADSTGAISSNIVNAINELTPLYTRTFKIKAGITNRLKEKHRFRLNLVNSFNVYIFATDVINISQQGSSSVDWIRETSTYTNFEYFLGLEPVLHLSDNFSLFTRSGLSLIIVDDSQRVRANCIANPFHGGFGLRYSF